MDEFYELLRKIKAFCEKYPASANEPLTPRMLRDWLQEIADEEEEYQERVRNLID